MFKYRHSSCLALRQEVSFMKTYLTFAVTWFLIATGILLLSSCSSGTDDFSDIKTIIKNDLEGIYGIELADDDEPAPVAKISFDASYTLFGKRYEF